MANNILDIVCPSCGAPAKFNIYKQIYDCQYCGNKVGIEEAFEQRRGFRKLHQDKVKKTVKDYPLVTASCSGCGAKVVIEEGEALSTCAFCGKSVVQKKYIRDDNMPEGIIPFAIDEKEARARLEKWCDANKSKREAKHLRPLLKDLKGYYLPYEMIQGPIAMKLSRKDRYGSHEAEGYIHNEFVNRSNQLDNILLDGMEPYDISSMAEFDFGYVAGQRVKISDIEEDRLKYRVIEEAEHTYLDEASKVFGSKALYMGAKIESGVRLPVLLPVYYIANGSTMAAVNGQTGKVAVRAEKATRHYFFPWWFKAIVTIIALMAIAISSFLLFGASLEDALAVSFALFVFFAFVVPVAFGQDAIDNEFSVSLGHKIYTSGDVIVKRKQGKLEEGETLQRKAEPLVFFKEIDGKKRPVFLELATPKRIASIICLAAFVIFLPVFIALIINGFDFGRLNLMGSGIWFCITVPTVPIVTIQYFREALYSEPWIYTYDENGKKKRYRASKFKVTKEGFFETIKMILGALVVPPICFATWFALAAIYFTIYFTAFGF